MNEAVDHPIDVEDLLLELHRTLDQLEELQANVAAAHLSACIETLSTGLDPMSSTPVGAALRG